MKRLSLWLLFFAVLGIQSALAQTYKVKGNVVSKSDNEPLIGVSILQKGTTNGVVTDIDGNYELRSRVVKPRWFSLISVCKRRN